MSRFPVLPHPSPTPEDDRAAVLRDPGFGTRFTDHMALAAWTANTGWTDRKVTAYAPFQLDPATSVLHYAQGVFEGLKAFAHPDGSVWAFRPEVNEARFAASCARMGLPALDDGDMVASITALTAADRAWVPTHDGASLYLRPFMFASQVGMSVQSATEVTYCCIASPSGPYFGGDGVQPVDIWFATDYIRAAPGGTGAAKCGGNYAGAMAAQLEAERHGCSQVGFVDAVERRYVEELGGMNLFAVTADGELLTPNLTGTILPGVTRSAILELAPEVGLTAVERPIELDELRSRADDGSITELFACGTAAVITPIGNIADQQGRHSIAGGKPGEATLALRGILTDIQYGRRPDERGWLTRLV
ncbi:branched-chain amino acid aminotransferase [Enemella sp. A6]|uniref:branched-chain amino acid aminotransferase n=1 Tax=Enemella sp. A6 TaxID=3440152 RepID=UPI003EBB206A